MKNIEFITMNVSNKFIVYDKRFKKALPSLK